MKEQDFLNVRNLSAVIHAKELLSDICIDSQPNIPPEQFRLVCEYLRAWQTALFKAASSATFASGTVQIDLESFRKWCEKEHDLNESRYEAENALEHAISASVMNLVLDTISRYERNEAR